MQLKAITLKNFRCYADEIKVDFADLTTFVGRNVPPFSVAVGFRVRG